MKKYFVICSWMKDQELINECKDYDDFIEALLEFNYNCAAIYGSTMLIDAESDIVIRQFVRRTDGNTLLK